MKAIVLCSGGLDSTTLLASAVKEFGNKEVLAVSLYYGQRHKKELVSAANVTHYYNVEQCSYDLSSLFQDSDCPLIATSYQKIPHESYSDQLEKMGGHGTVSTYVPFRNGLFLSFATSLALIKGAYRIYYGAHADDAAGAAYPDCTPEFIESQKRAIYFGTAGKTRLIAPFQSWNKAQIVKYGIELKVPYELTWSCYEGGDVPCGVCGTCIDRAAAFAANGIKDPALR